MLSHWDAQCSAEKSRSSPPGFLSLTQWLLLCDMLFYMLGLIQHYNKRKKNPVEQRQQQRLKTCHYWIFILKIYKSVTKWCLGRENPLHRPHYWDDDSPCLNMWPCRYRTQWLLSHPAAHIVVIHYFNKVAYQQICLLKHQLDTLVMTFKYLTLKLSVTWTQLVRLQ